MLNKSEPFSRLLTHEGVENSAMRLRSLAITVLSMMGIAVSPALAQETAFGYAFAGPMAVDNVGDRTTAWNVGGGGEAWIGKDTSVGAELGYVYFPLTQTSGPGYSGRMPAAEALLLSVNGFRHFRRSRNRLGWQPFVTGGISLLLDSESFGMVNMGGGADRWMTDHAGLRVEVRDQLVVTSHVVGSVLLGVRVGVVLR
jgi:hypothetical protein